MIALDIIEAKNGLMKLQVQIEDSIKNCKSDEVRKRREESNKAIVDAIFLISTLQTDLEHSAMVQQKLRAEIKSLKNVLNSKTETNQ